LREALGKVTMQVFVRRDCAMIAAPVQCDVDGIPKGSHYVRVPIAIGRPNETQDQLPLTGASLVNIENFLIKFQCGHATVSG
jgi:hypothetical protein